MVLTWEADPANDTLEIDNGVGDVSALSMITVNPTDDTTYTLTGIRNGNPISRTVTVLVARPPVIDEFMLTDSSTILEGGSTSARWDVFGETSLDLNGTDVMAESSTTLSPTETTTYTLTATNAFGSTTADITVTVLDGSSPDLGWSATFLPDGTLERWDPTTNATGNDGIAWVRSTGGTVQSGASNFAGIGKWINSPGYDLSANPLDSWQDGLGDAVTKADVSWEMVFRPGDFTGRHTLFNTGGDGAGTGIVLIDGTLEFRFQAVSLDAQRIILSTDLSAIGSATDFFHIVALADVNLGPGVGTLYVNGQLVAGPITSTGNIQDWDGGDLAEIGKGDNIPAGNPFSPDTFTGDVAMFNYYGDRLLNADQVDRLYQAIAGESPFAITDIGYDADLDELSLTFTANPGTYALYATTDLTPGFGPQNWLEVDDSIIANAGENTITLQGVILPDSETPRRFFRLGPPAE